jgi:hypothetical protein
MHKYSVMKCTKEICDMPMSRSLKIIGVFVLFIRIPNFIRAFDILIRAFVANLLNKNVTELQIFFPEFFYRRKHRPENPDQ